MSVNKNHIISRIMSIGSKSEDIIQKRYELSMEFNKEMQLLKEKCNSDEFYSKAGPLIKKHMELIRPYKEV